jgi:hypothetical protein
MRLPHSVRFARWSLGSTGSLAAFFVRTQKESEEEPLKAKHLLVLAWLLWGANACSDDDQGMGDPCQGACGKLSACGTGVACGGMTLEPSTCASVCRQRQAVGAANCVLGVTRCSDIDKLQACAAKMPCS